jgi:hypothetical protein
MAKHSVVTRSDYFDTRTVQQAIDEAAHHLGQSIERWYARIARNAGPLSQVESPIEAVFWVWWMTLEIRFWARLECPMPFGLVAQHVVQLADDVSYRLDFAVAKHRLAIELDGHDFHERTKEQVIHRNERDRRLQLAGWTVLHYSGTELLRDPSAVVRDVYRRCLIAEGIVLDD